MAAHPERQYRPPTAMAGVTDGEVSVDTIQRLGEALNNYVRYAGRPHLLCEMFVNAVATSNDTTEKVVLPPWVMVVPRAYTQLMWQIRHKRTAGAGNTTWKLYASRDRIYDGDNTAFDSTRLMGAQSSSIVTSSDTVAISGPAYTSLSLVRSADNLVRCVVTGTDASGNSAAMYQLHIWGCP